MSTGNRQCSQTDTYPIPTPRSEDGACDEVDAGPESYRGRCAHEVVHRAGLRLSGRRYQERHTERKVPDAAENETGEHPAPRETRFAEHPCSDDDERDPDRAEGDLRTFGAEWGHVDRATVRHGRDDHKDSAGDKGECRERRDRDAPSARIPGRRGLTSP